MAMSLAAGSFSVMTTAFSKAYPADRGLLARVFLPVVEPLAYLRFIHLLLMMPLGIAYFTFFVTAFSTGGSLIWTFVGPPIIFVAMYASLRLGDLELWLVNFVWREEIRRPPQRLEGMTSFRQKVWARVIDPSAWTALVYEFAQFPIGIGAFIATVTGFFASFYLMISPLIVLISGEQIQVGEDAFLYFDRPIEALPLVPLGAVGWVLSVHILTAFSALHSGWAQLMLGSRSRHRPTPEDYADPDANSGPPPALSPPPADPNSSIAIADPEPADNVETEDHTMATDDDHDPLLKSLTAREREVALLLARGFSNADIAEHCYISEGTVNHTCFISLRSSTSATALTSSSSPTSMGWSGQVRTRQSSTASR
jgi:hypothetical protein